MPLIIELTKAQRQQFKKDILAKMETLEGDELKRAAKYIEEMGKLKENKTITKDEMLVIIKAKLLKDHYCEKIINEVNLQNQLEFDLEQSVNAFLKDKTLPKTTSEERIAVLENANTLFLDRKRMLITEKTGTDPDPVFLGKSEDGKLDIYEGYYRCHECKTVYKSFKGNQGGSRFCSPECRRKWWEKNMHVLNEIEDKIEAEKNAETFEWERIGTKTDKEGSLGTYGVFRKVFKND